MTGPAADAERGTLGGWDAVSRLVQASDGVELHCLRWYSGRSPPWAVVIFLHGIASHGGWFAETAADLDTEGVAVYAPDRRGSGRSGGPRGHLDRYERALDDVDEVARLVSAEHPGTPLFLAASSWAAKLGVVYAARRPARLSGLLLLGGPEVLEFADIDRPVPTDNEVLVQVRAAGLHRGDWHVMTGLPYMIRLAVPTLGLRKPKVPVLGMDVAGVVEGVGAQVTRFRPGDEVFGWCDGAFAEYACAPEDHFAAKPATLSFEQAAVVPISGFAALQGVRDVGEVQAGQTVLVIGAAGAVGWFAVQLAKAFGGEVAAVASTSQLELVRSIGADEVIDYTRTDVTDGTRQWEVIIDTGGRRSLSRLRRALTPKGTLVIVGGEGGGRWMGGFLRNLRAPLVSRFVGQRLRMLVSKERQEDLQVLGEFIEAGKLTPRIGRTYPLGEAAEAMRALEAGDTRGKIVITV